jgi:hypothetical protein
MSTNRRLRLSFLILQRVGPTNAAMTTTQRERKLSRLSGRQQRVVGVRP